MELKLANTTLTAQIIANEAVRVLDNNLVMAKKVFRGYEEEFTKSVNGYERGATIDVRKPTDFTVTDGKTLGVQDVVEGKTNISVDKQKHVAFKFSSSDLTLNIKELSERVIKPAMVQLANQIDSDLQSLYYKIPSWVGTPGQTINSFADFSLAPRRLDAMAVPQDGRCMTMVPEDYWALTSQATNLLSNNIVGDAYKSGKLGMLGGVDTYMTQNVKSHTTGAFAGTVLVDQVLTSATTSYESVKDTMTQTLHIDGLTSATATIKAGDVFTIADVYAVNPVTKERLDFLREFTVMEDATAASNEVDLTIYPALIFDGAQQTVSTDVADLNNQGITFKGTQNTVYPQNMVFHKNAMALVSVPLVRPAGVPSNLVGRQTYEGTSVRVVPIYDGTNDDSVWRLDVLYGTQAIDPRLATRASGTA